MSYRRPKGEAWDEWRKNASRDAHGRWAEAQNLVRPKMTGKEWLKETRKRLVQMAEVSILPPREQSRVCVVAYRDLARADQDRLRERGLVCSLFAFAIASESADEPLARRFLRLSPGKRLRDGRLSFQVFIDEHERVPVGMNIQLRGMDPARGDRPTYLRYDLDVVPMGTGPVAHFGAHWHAGDDSDAHDAEDHDPRLPSLLLDPLAVLDVLIETFFPNGPSDVNDETDAER